MPTRREMLFGLALAFALLCGARPGAAGRPAAVVERRRRPSRRSSIRPGHHRAGRPDFVAPGQRIATFDQDGTLWVEHPIYSQVVFALDRVVALAPEHPEWKTKEPFKTVLSGDKEAMAKLSLRDLEEIVFATHAGMTRRGVQRDRDGVGRQSQGRSLEPALHRAGLPADAGGAAPAARQRLPRPTSSPAAARTSCAPMPNASTASGRPRSSARHWTPSTATTPRARAC